jgi:hypothetical protein
VLLPLPANLKSIIATKCGLQTSSLETLGLYRDCPETRCGWGVPVVDRYAVAELTVPKRVIIPALGCNGSRTCQSIRETRHIRQARHECGGNN